MVETVTTVKHAQGMLDPPFATDTVAPEPVYDGVRSVPQLAAELSTAPFARATFALRLVDLQRQNSRTLIARIASTECKPLILWAIHLELDKRGIPPRLRWPPCADADLQSQYITWLADVLWLARRYPNHQVCFKNWQGAFKHPPATTAWHKSLHARYLYATRRPRSAHYFALGFGLHDLQRGDLMTFQTNGMRAATRKLGGIDAVRATLINDAYAHKDKAGRHDPIVVAQRRTELWKLHLLTGQSQAATVRYYELIHGQRISRQNLKKQLDAVELSLGRAN